MTTEERKEALVNPVAFFWAMCNVAAKTIARRQSWNALSMLSMLLNVLEDVEWLVSLREERSSYKDQPGDVPPVHPAEQLAMLRHLADRMEKLTPRIEATGIVVPLQAIQQTYGLLGLMGRAIE